MAEDLDQEQHQLKPRDSPARASGISPKRICPRSSCAGALETRRELPLLAILLRLDDWVEEVREKADRVASKKLGSARPDLLVPIIPLLEALSRRSRAQNTLSLQRFRTAIGSPANFQHVVDELDLLPGKGARWATQLLLETASDKHLAALFEEAPQFQDSIVRLLIVRRMTQCKDTRVENTLTSLIGSDRSSAVRYAALAWAIEEAIPNLNSIFRDAIFDPSPRVRNLALYQLREQTEISPNIEYRTRLNSSLPRNSLRGALAGIAEVGDPKVDASLIREYLCDSRASVVCAAVKALAKLDADTHFLDFLTALESSSPSISKAGRQALFQFPRQHAFGELKPLLHSQVTHVRKNTLIVLLRRGSKWDRLELLLSSIHDEEEQIVAFVMEKIRTWLANFNRSSAFLKDEQRLRCQSAFLARPKSLPFEKDLESILFDSQ